jgi:hypothetical protein
VALSDDYETYLIDNYPNLRFYIIVFASKWLTSVLLALTVVTISAFAQAVKFFSEDSSTVKKMLCSLILPSYFVAVFVQQFLSACFGLWFFSNLWYP